MKKLTKQALETFGNKKNINIFRPTNIDKEINLNRKVF